jgi:hypothetical protein
MCAPKKHTQVILWKAKLEFIFLYESFKSQLQFKIHFENIIILYLCENQTV